MNIRAPAAWASLVISATGLSCRHVGGVSYGDQLRFGGNLSLQIIHIQRAIRFANIDLLDHHAFFFQRAPRRDVCVVVQRVTTISSPGFSSLPIARASAKVMSSCSGEDHFVRIAIEKIGHRGAGGQNHFIVAPLVRNAPQVSHFGAQKIILHRVHDLLGYLRARRAIQKGRAVVVVLQTSAMEIVPSPRRYQMILSRSCASAGVLMFSFPPRWLRTQVR